MKTVYNMIDIEKFPDCIICGSRPMFHVEPSWEKTYPFEGEWQASKDSHKFIVSCPNCGKYASYNSSDAYAAERAQEGLLKDWTDRKVQFTRCHAVIDAMEEDDDSAYHSCDDAEVPGNCDSCPHWRFAECKKCGCRHYTLLHRDVDDPNLTVYACSKCGALIRGRA